MKKKIWMCSLIVVVAAIIAVGSWLLMRNRNRSTSGNVLNVAWYDENGTEFTITTVDEFYEFAELSEHYDFKDQTIKLGADIVFNEGQVSDWVDIFPEYVWEPIKGFAGTFDGQGHSISGVCGKDYGYNVIGKNVVHSAMGLFIDTKKDCVIRDFKLLNSYFCHDDSGGLGSVVGSGVGTIENIYSDAVIAAYESCNGGIIGYVSGQGSATIRNCWFDGTVTVTGNRGQYTGGIAGRVAPTNGTVKIEHCLNTGDISSDLWQKSVNMGGIVGNAQNSSRLNVTDCLNVGTLTNDWAVTTGAVIGNVEYNSSVNINDVYTKSDCYRAIIGNVSGTINGAPIQTSEKRLFGMESARWTSLNFDEYWAVVEDGTPVLQYFVEEDPSVEGIEKAYDTSWYDKTKSEFTINTLEQLYGFAYLSYETNFSGKTVKLGADIVVNEGNSKEWLKGAETNTWIPIGPYGFPFAGIFDGQMHSVSGVYSNDGKYNGMFSQTAETAALKNFKLTNSYISSTFTNVGSIAAMGGGTFDTIYSDADVVGSAGNVGGLVGSSATAGLTMVNCWYDGEVISTGNDKWRRNTGGLVAVATGVSTINNCLNTGVVDASIYTYNQSPEGMADSIVPVVGGLVGRVESKKNLVLKYSLNVGEIKINELATTGYGSLIGYVSGAADVTYTYATKESCQKQYAGTKITGLIVPVDANTIKGYRGHQMTLLDFDKYWSVVKADTPILKSFASSVPSLAGYAKMVDVSWYDENKKTYVLYDAADLNGLSLLSGKTDFAGKTIKLGADIVVNKGIASAWANSEPAYPWTPISSFKIPFTGTFDGCMHSISGLYMNVSQMYSGLFAVTSKDAVIKNLKITNSYMNTTGESIGSVAGCGRGTFDTIYSDAIIVSSRGYVGGMIGQAATDAGVAMKNCWFDGMVTSTGNTMANRRTAGLIGFVRNDSTITSCLNTGVIDVSAFTFNQGTDEKPVVWPCAGGFTGDVASKKVLKISDSLNAGEIICSSSATGAYGAIAGYLTGKLHVSLVYATTESCKTPLGRWIGLTGKIYQKSEAELSGYDGYQWTLLDFDKYWAVVADNAATQENEADTPILKVFAGTVPSLDVKRMVDISWYDESKDEYVLYDAADLYGLALLSEDTDFAKKTIKLGADIVVNTGDASTYAASAPQYQWIPMNSFKKPFAGTFDGGMYSISGLYINTSEMYSGLFAVTSKDAVIKNLKITNSYMNTTAESIGSIVGCGRGTFKSIYSDAIVVSSRGYVGGMIGQAATDIGVTMKNCWFDGEVTSTGNTMGNRRTGGLIGFVRSDSTITSCLNTGNIDVSAYSLNQGTDDDPVVWPCAGGFTGDVASKKVLKISDSLNTGKIICSSSATGAYGSINGYLTGELDATFVYATTESCKTPLGRWIGLTGKIYQKREAELSGYDGYQWTHLDFDKYWVVVADNAATQENEANTPILKSFADKVPSLDVKRMVDISWYDESKDKYVLYDEADLYGLAELVDDGNNFSGKKVILGDDIVINTGNASDWATAAPAYKWNPIGDASTSNIFAGTFDGDGHTISGLYLEGSGWYNGLFAQASKDAVIRDFRLTNSYIKSSGPVLGSVVGYANGKVEKIYSDAIVVSSNKVVGGIVGKADGSFMMLECWFDGTVTATGNGNGIRATGGLIGEVAVSCEVKYCLNSGTIDAFAYTYDQDTGDATVVLPYVGGLIGTVTVTSKNITIYATNLLNVGEVKYSGEATGGYGSIVGYIGSKTTSGTTYAGKISTGKTDVIYATEESCPVTTNISFSSILTDKEAHLKGYLGYQLTQLDFDNYWAVVLDDETTSDVDESGTPILKAFATVVPSLDGIDPLSDTSWYREGDEFGTDEEPYILYNRADLYGLAELVDGGKTFEGKTVKLANNIVVNTGKASDWTDEDKEPAYKWNPIGDASTSNIFAGTFDGDGHTISGLYLEGSGWYNGLFAQTSKDAVIRDFRLTNSYIKSSGPVLGSVVGYANGKVEKIYSDAIVVSSNKVVGGIVGKADGSFKMLECWFDGTVTATGNGKGLRATGGLIGEVAVSCEVKYCLNSGTIDASAYAYNESTTTEPVVLPYVGGLIGTFASGKKIYVDDLLNVGEVKVNDSATSGYGSLVGAMLGTLGSGSDVYATIESCSMATTSDAKINNIITTVKKAELMGYDGYRFLPKFDFAKYWVVVVDDETTTDVDESGTPILKTFAKVVPSLEGVSQLSDTSWYREGDVIGTAENPYKLYNRADLYGLAELVNGGNPFSGKTILLADDIVINYGNASDWETTAPTYAWTSIGSSTTPFAGTFDGDGHTISGLYMKSTSWNSGLFSETATTAKICNFKLTNSYMNSNKRNFGSIVAMGRGRFEKIYSDAIIVSSEGNVGGLIGQVPANSNFAMFDCWFNGTVTAKGSGNYARRTGGLIGLLSVSCELKRCLNSGIIDASAYKYDQDSSSATVIRPMVGGLVGEISSGYTLYSDQLLNVGEVKYSGNATDGYGSIVGFIDGAKGFSAGSTAIYATEESCSMTTNKTYANIKKVKKADITGEADAVKTTLQGFNFATYWSLVKNGTPVLKMFQ